MAKKTKRAEAGGPGGTYFLKNLEQLKVLADPLRIRILECLCQHERTTKQVAEKLGESPTRLYHHVDALQQVGLIRLTRTRQNRGTLEKYYSAVARRFEADPALFTSTGTSQLETAAEFGHLADSVLARTARELSALMMKDPSGATLRDSGLFSFVELHLDREEVLKFRADLIGLLEEVAGRSESRKEASRAGKIERFRLTLALLPIQDE